MHDESGMTKADRANLERLARKRAKVAESMIGERVKALRADVEDRLTAEHKIDDELWADVNREAREAVAKADRHVAAACARLGIPENLRPSIRVSWSGRGDNALASRRTELRRLAYARIDAAAESAKVAIRANLLDVETELIRGGLESAAAIAFVDAMPSVEQLMPVVDVASLEPGVDRRPEDVDELAEYYRRRSGNTWEPPMHAAGELLTPSTASSREVKRQAVAAALATSPASSNRQIARTAGVDHKTVGKLRGESAGTSPRTASVDHVDTGSNGDGRAIEP